MIRHYIARTNERIEESCAEERAKLMILGLSRRNAIYARRCSRTS